MKAELMQRFRSGLRAKFTTEERFVPESSRKNLYRCAFILIGLGSVLFVALVIQVMNNVGIVGLDAQVEKWFLSIRNPFMTIFNIVLAVIFGPIALPIIIFVVTVLWIIFAKHAWRPLILAGFTGLGVVAIQIITRIVQRPRPPVGSMLFGQDATFSFPSGHVSGTADFCLILAYLIVSRKPTRRRIAVATVIATIVISSQVISRVYLGYHWLSDTLASICLAMIILGIVIALDTWRTVRVPGERVKGGLSKVQTENT